MKRLPRASAPFKPSAVQRGVLDALALLGTARAKAPAPTDGERQALTEEAASYGLTAQRGMGGVG